MTQTVTQKTAKKHLVQTASTWGTWTTDTSLICDYCEEGYCNDLGSAALWRPIGRVSIPGATTHVDRTPLANTVGLFVRVLLQDNAGTITVNSVNYKALWYGIITGKEIESRDVGVVESFSCAGLAYFLDQRQLKNGYIVNDATDFSTAWPPKDLNKIPGGDASASTYSGIGSARIQDWSPAGDQVEFDAYHVAELLLNATNLQFGGPTWSLGGLASTALNFRGAFSIDGTILEALARVINPRNGVGFRVIVVAGQPVVTVFSHLPSAITAGGVTFPASDEANALDLSTAVEAGQWRYKEDQSATYDWIGVEGGHQRYAASLNFPDQMDQGWDAALEAGWDSAFAAGDLEKLTDGVLAMVGRRYVLDPAWDGTDESGHDVVMGARNTTTSAEYGTNGENAIWISGTLPNGNALRFTQQVPLYEGKDWSTTVTLSTLDRTLPLMKPQVYIVVGADWYPLGEFLGREVGSEVNLTVEDDAPAVVLQLTPTEAYDLRTELAAGAELVFSLGIEHPAPMRVAWNRGTGTRTIVVPAPKYRFWRGCEDFVLGLDGVTPTRLGPADQDVIYELAGMRQRLAVARAVYSLPQVEFTWRNLGTIDDSDATGPGALVTTATVPLDNAATTAALTVNGPVTNRRWSLSLKDYGTTCSTRPLNTDVQAVT